MGIFNNLRKSTQLLQYLKNQLSCMWFNVSNNMQTPKQMEVFGVHSKISGYCFKNLYFFLMKCLNYLLISYWHLKKSMCKTFCNFNVYFSFIFQHTCYPHVMLLMLNIKSKLHIITCVNQFMLSPCEHSDVNINYNKAIRCQFVLKWTRNQNVRISDVNYLT